MTATAAKNDPEQGQTPTATTPAGAGAAPDSDGGDGGVGSFTLGSVRALAQVMKDYDLGELELSRPSGERLRLKSRRADVATVQPAYNRDRAAGLAAPETSAAPAASAPAKDSRAKEPGVTVIAAPLVGTFYRSPSPEAPSFVEVGQRVKKGQALCIIEAMKLMNELESDVDGVVVAILGENGRPVEYGEPLFHIKAG